MRQITRTIILVSLLALFGAVSLGGPGLHTLQGCGHSATVGADGGDASATGLVPHSLSPDHCPICQFLAQGQLLEEAPRPIVCDRVAFRGVDAYLTPAPADFRRPSSPRAPPTGHLPLS